MALLRLFSTAREAAGVSEVRIEAATVDDVLAQAVARFGPRFEEVLRASRVWVDLEPVPQRGSCPVTAATEVAVLPPIAGG